MIRIKVTLIILLLFFSNLYSQSFINKIKVPIYYTSSMSIGYDSNVFRLSDIDLKIDTNNDIINSKTFDGAYLNPKIDLKYSPYLLKNIITQFNFSFGRNHYLNSSDKSYDIFYSELGFKFDSYHWLKLSHRFIPKYYLRNYIDSDYSDFQNIACTFSIETINLSYSRAINELGWARVRFAQTNWLYNEHFTEYDTKISLIELKYFFKGFKASNNLWYSYSKADNSSYNTGYNSTNIDRSFNEHNWGVSSKIRARHIIKTNIIDNIGFSLLVKNRIYNMESIDDFDFWQYENYNGREHLETNFSFWIDKKINNQLTNQIKFKYRIRNVESVYDWIRDHKGFNKYEIIYKFSINSDLGWLY